MINETRTEEGEGSDTSRMRDFLRRRFRYKGLSEKLIENMSYLKSMSDEDVRIFNLNHRCGEGLSVGLDCFDFDFNRDVFSEEEYYKMVDRHYEEFERDPLETLDTISNTYADCHIRRKGGPVYGEDTMRIKLHRRNEGLLQSRNEYPELIEESDFWDLPLFKKIEKVERYNGERLEAEKQRGLKPRSLSGRIDETVNLVFSRKMTEEQYNFIMDNTPETIVARWMKEKEDSEE
ncbi:hypothetical protein CMI47_01275 [Candidatus Pacearchaeota archaeon]|nr:hypothetical protein [Candidatus Pacearchaeota archaeon]|tara:strand:+ start:45 stop:746 length:702 start_codon:yes stop_codon:yes gene_type:complete